MMSSIAVALLLCALCLNSNVAVNHWELASDGSIQPQVGILVNDFHVVVSALISLKFNRLIRYFTCAGPMTWLRFFINSTIGKR